MSICHHGYPTMNVHRELLLSLFTVHARSVRFEDGSFSGYVKMAYPVVPSAWVTPDALHKFYSIPDGMTGDVTGNSQVCACGAPHLAYGAMCGRSRVAEHSQVSVAWLYAGCHRVRRPVSRGFVGTPPPPTAVALTQPYHTRRFYSVSDLATFSKLSGVPQPDVTVVGSNNSSEPGGEATLDIQLITSTGQGIPTYFWYVGRR